MLDTAIRTQPDPQTIDLNDAIKMPAGKKRLHATPINRILDRKSREVVGWLYEWNTGERRPMWKTGRCEDVIYE